jgi:predicted dehydrogenase
MADQVRIGFIGAGGIARHHMRSLAAIPEAKVVAFAEPSQVSIDRMVEAYPDTAHIPVYADYRQMLKEVDLDAVEIHSPHTLHYSQGMDVLHAGKHLLMEKPLVCTTPNAYDLIEAGKGLVFMISYQRHFQGPYLYIRDQLQGGALGKIQYVAALQSQGWMRGTQGTWRQEKALSGGGQINDSGSHLIDILLWTTGLTAESVFAYQQNYDCEVDIDTALSMRFTNGAQGTISIVGDSPMWWEEFSVWGSQGALLYRNGKIMQRAYGATEMTEVTDLPPDSTPDRNFVDAILGRAQVGVPPECGLRVIELTEAAWRSAELGRAVVVSELA